MSMMNHAIRILAFLASCLALGSNVAAETLPIVPAESDVAYGDCPVCTGAGCLNMCVMDLYVPTGGALGVVVYVHGGSWVSGDKRGILANSQAMLESYLERGFLVASLNYRLSTPPPGEQLFTYSDSTSDIAQAVDWLMSNSSPWFVHGVDPQAVQPVLVGFSAGTHLVSLVVTDPGYSSDLAWTPGDIGAVVALDGHAYDIPYALDLMTGTAIEAEKGMIVWLFGNEEAGQLAGSPANFVDPAVVLPPSLLMSTGANYGDTGTRDYVAYETTRRYGEDVLGAAGKDWQHFHYETENHASLEADFGLEGDLPTADFYAFLDSNQLPPLPPLTWVNVADLDGTAFSASDKWRADAIISVTDSNHAPVPFATVRGTWSGGFSGDSDCVTDSSGTCTVGSGDITAEESYTAFTVIDVNNAFQAYEYDPAANRDADGNSNGIGIRIYRDGTTESPDEPLSLAPTAPSGLTATGVSQAQIDLNWVHDDSSEDGFRIGRSLAGQNNWAVVATLAAGVTSYSDSAVAPDTSYDYQVMAYNDSGQATSDIASATSLAAPGLTLTATAYKRNTSQRVILEWAYFRDPVDVYRDGALLATAVSGNFYKDDTTNIGSATYTHRVCPTGESPGSELCSNETVTGI